MALQVIESLGNPTVEFGETSRVARPCQPTDCLSGDTQEPAAGGFGRFGRNDGPQDEANAGGEHCGKDALCCGATASTARSDEQKQYDSRNNIRISAYMVLSKTNTVSVDSQ